MLRIFEYRGKHYEFEYKSDEKIVDLVFNEIFVDGDYKEGLTHIRKIDEPVVLDVGAFVGISPAYFSQHKKATIYAVEPNPFSHQALVANSEKYKKIIPIGVGIGYETRPRQLVVPFDNSTAMSFYGKGDQAYEVFTYAIDDFFQHFDITHVDLMKIDTEGAEYEIFLSEGFAKVASKIDMIIGEAHDLPLNHQVLPEILKRNGFNTIWKKDLNYVSVTTYKLGSMEGEIRTKLATLFIARH